MKKTLTIFLCICSLFQKQAIAQTDSFQAIAEISTFQKKLNEEYRNREESIFSFKRPLGRE